MANYEKSPVDHLFYRLMGYYPSKKGKSYEIISTAILGLVEDKNALHDQFLTGESKTRYQLDGRIGGNIMLEAKDYTQRQKKVGRGDLQRLQGALTDLSQIEKGYFTSATEYTRPAKKYAEGSSANPCQKEIIPIELRPSTQEDEKGRIAKIDLSLIMIYPNFEKGKYAILFSDNEKLKFEEYLRNSKRSEIHLRIAYLYNSEGDVVDTIEHVYETQRPDIPENATEINGVFDISAYVKIGEQLFAINGIKYHIPLQYAQTSFAIEPNGNATILVKSEKLGINKLITDTDLKKAINRLSSHKGRLCMHVTTGLS